MEDPRWRQILEVGSHATMDEIDRSYHLLKRVYGSAQSSFAAPAMDECSEKARKAILAQIESAYAQVCRARSESKPAPAPVAAPVEALPQEALHRARAAAGITLDYLISQTHVRPDYLVALEEERFHELPLAEVTLRGYLTAYVTALGLPGEPLVPEYMQRFQRWRAQKR